MREPKKINIPLLAVICVHIVLVVFLFLFVKKQFHSDEVWSFGIANGSVSGPVFMDEDDNPINIGEWVSAEVLHENLTVQDEERFDFSIPYRNAVNDYHPPLTFFLIHLVGSFFPDVFSFWFFIPFNILAMVLCDIYLYRILKLYDFPTYVGILACVFQMLCVGGINMAAYLRMYTLLTAFGLMIAYYSLKLLKEDEFSVKSVMIFIVVNILGGLTCYEYFVYAFFVTVSICLLLLLKKRWKRIFQYGLSMLLGVGIAIAVFPEAVSDMVGNVGGDGFSEWLTYPYPLQFKMLIRVTLNDVIGIAPNPYISYWKPFVPFLLLLVFVLIICAPLVFLMRKEEKFKKTMDKIKTWIGDGWKEKSVLIRNCFTLFLFCIVTFLSFLAVMNCTISFYQMKSQSSRYLFVAYPLIIIFFVTLAFLIGNLIFSKDWMRFVLLFCLVTFFCVASQFHGGHTFVKTRELNGRSIREVENANIIIVLYNYSGLERLANIISPTNNLFAFTYNEMENYREELIKAEEMDNVYVAVQESAISADWTANVGDSLNLENFEDIASESKAQSDENLEDILTEIKESFVSHEADMEEFGSETTLNDGFWYYRVNFRER